jgi:hypothetical protein
MKRLVLCVSILSLLPVPAVRADKAAVAFPDGYRHWTHVKSMVLTPEHALANPFAGIHHIYANDRALEGYRASAFPDGSVLVFDLLEYTVADGAGTEGPRKLVGVMRKDAKKFAATGGWGYEGFKGDSTTERLVTDGGVSCHACHAARKDSHYVFSKMR